MIVPEVLDLTRVTRDRSGASYEYTAYAVELHDGEEMLAGHHSVCVKANGAWFYCNDAAVTRVSATAALCRNMVAAEARLGQNVLTAGNPLPCVACTRLAHGRICSSCQG